MLAQKQGRKEPVYNILQTQFKNNTDSCWFASALINWGNNVYKKKITLDQQRDIEKKAYNDHRMPKAGLTVSGGLRRISETLDCGYIRFAFGSPQFHDALNAGKCVCVTIMITQSFLDQWRGTEDIGDCKGNNQ